MYLHDLRAPDGARVRARRIGRGTGSGKGKTAGRGQKGQHARGQGFRLGFEGGQMPLAQRLPKLPGFKNPFKTVYAAINLTKLNRFTDGATVTPETLAEAGLIDPGEPVKVLGAGKLRRRLVVTAHAGSESARAAIEARGGTLTVLEPERRAAAGTPEAEAAPEAQAEESE
ncbi:MAG: 50S ribosomal protein L15 [Candidatus Dormibacteraeota bacterium]|nr:50S ribosomal protein L15 [Candidatus Dormibacteraeota bacterium]MBO0760068.1 50S ribosomal protein L15 [Candidatus Dormibacteraeota bacterium]